MNNTYCFHQINVALFFIIWILILKGFFCFIIKQPEKLSAPRLLLQLNTPYLFSFLDTRNI